MHQASACALRPSGLVEHGRSRWASCRFLRGGAKRLRPVLKGIVDSGRRPTSWTRPVSGVARARADARHGHDRVRQGEEAVGCLTREHGGRVLMAADRSGTTVSAVTAQGRMRRRTHELLSDPVGREGRPAGLRRWRDATAPCAAVASIEPEPRQRSMPLDGGTGSGADLHVQTVNSRHSRLKDFLRPRRGICSLRYLDNYLSWFHLVGLRPRTAPMQPGTS